jgi:ankyrin repeat protein
VSQKQFVSKTHMQCYIKLIFVFEENVTLVSYLVCEGADISIKDEVGRTPLFLASQLGKWNVVEPILTACKSVDTRFVINVS